MRVLKNGFCTAELTYACGIRGARGSTPYASEGVLHYFNLAGPYT